ncbi:MAG: glycosyltransferase family 2 protein [Chloroflexi bacterium]|nr:glycosyltransferase family 2 protein [Chloroflexota bacterium]
MPPNHPHANSLDLSLVIPAYNEVDSLAILHDKITAVLEKLSVRWEVIYIDDGSTDGTLDVLHTLRAEDQHVVVAAQRRNFGKSLALTVGFALAQGKQLITMDADLQDEPAEIPRLIAKLDEGYDVVVGWKKHRQDPLSKTIPSKIANSTTAWATGLRIHDMNSGLKAYRAECVRRIQVYGDLHRYIPVIAHYNGFRVTEIPVQHHPRQYGSSKYGPGRLLRGGFDLLTVVFLHNYRYRPLHLFGGTGFVLAFTGFLINLYLTFEWFRGNRPLSERPLLTLGVLLMVVGFQLLTMGLLAELLVSYIQRNEDPLRTTATVWAKQTAAAQTQIEQHPGKTAQ